MIDWKKIKPGDEVEVTSAAGESTRRCEVFAIDDTDVPIYVRNFGWFRQDLTRNFLNDYRITAHYPKGSPDAPKPEPAAGSPEWAEQQARAGKRVRHCTWYPSAWVALVGGEWKDDTGCWDIGEKHLCIPRSSRLRTGWELAPDAATPPEPEQPAVLINEWYDVDGDPTRVVGKSAEGARYVCEYIDDGDFDASHHDADELTHHLPNFDPATDKLIDGKVYAPKQQS